MEERRKVYGWLVRDGNAAVGCSSMWAGTRGGENYCGNLLWRASLTLLFPEMALTVSHRPYHKGPTLGYIQVRPETIPSSRIQWSVVSGAATFPSGSAGTEVDVLGSSGMVDLEVRVLGATDERMHFKSKVQ